MKNFTAQEVLHFTALFYNNWIQEDFEIAFKASHLGWDYHWDKLQGKIKDGANPTQAIVSVVLNMDSLHQTMFTEYILNKKYTQEILEQREWSIELANHMKNNIEKHKNNGKK